MDGRPITADTETKTPGHLVPDWRKSREGIVVKAGSLRTYRLAVCSTRKSVIFHVVLRKVFERRESRVVR